MSEADTPVETLLAEAREGKAPAVEALLERYRPFLRLLVRCKLPAKLAARADGSDVVQETLLCAARNLAGFRGGGEPEWRAWLARIAEREIIRQTRRHLGADRRAVGREAPLPDGSGSVTGAPRLDAWLAASGAGPSASVQRRERAALLAAALDRLPADYREVLVLRHLQGLEFAEVALRMGRSSGAARVLWTRALRRLREVLDEDRRLQPDVAK